MKTINSGYNGKNVPFEGDTKKVGNIISPYANRKDRRSGMVENLIPNSTKTARKRGKGVTAPLRSVKQLKNVSSN